MAIFLRQSKTAARNSLVKERSRKSPLRFFSKIKLRLFLILALTVFVYGVIVNLRSAALHLDHPYQGDLLNNRPTETNTKTTAYIQKIADDLLKLLSATTPAHNEDDTNAGNDRSKLFEILSINQNNFDRTSMPPKYCRCDLISVDCLDSIACIPHDHRNEHKRRIIRHALVWIGIEMRRAIKKTSVFEGHTGFEDQSPMGKSLQYAAMTTWTKWRSENVLPKAYESKSHLFVNESWYPGCQYNISMKDDSKKTKYHRGLSCFYQGLSKRENDAGNKLEIDATRYWFKGSSSSDSNSSTTKTTSSSKEAGITKVRIRKKLETFLKNLQPKLDDDGKEKIVFSAWGNLLLFSHIARLLFSRRPFLEEIFQARYTSLPVKNRNNNKNEYDPDDPFIVGLHMRRGDACSEERPKLYQQLSSPLNSTAQHGGDRKCYQTRVYIDAIRRIRQLVPKTRPLHVNIATDDVGDVMDEILHMKFDYSLRRSKKNSRSPVEVPVDQWNFMNYSRSHFSYEGNIIEGDDNMNVHILGETATSDLWLLSRSDAFVGHMGSRFGKVAWLLATSRHNAFVPFFSVDGHSFCCEIDENCSEMKPYITDMENCLTFGHEYVDFDQNDSYWNVGSLARKIVYLNPEWKHHQELARKKEMRQEKKRKKKEKRNEEKKEKEDYSKKRKKS